MNQEPTAEDYARIQTMNQRAVENQFFTPDTIYLELGLFKDFRIGALYLDAIKNRNQAEFERIQAYVNSVVMDYQTRMFDTVSPYFDGLGVTDSSVEAIIADKDNHELLFLLSPSTMFLQMLIRHIARNVNHSAPANKFTKRTVGKGKYVLDPQDVTVRINTYPLVLKDGTTMKFAHTLGESLGINITFMCKDPGKFNRQDWLDWMEATDCFYIENFSRFQNSDYTRLRQAEMDMANKYIFACKRISREVLGFIKQIDLEIEIQKTVATIGFQSNFEWIANNDLRLTEEPIIQREPDTLDLGIDLEERNES